MPFVRKRRAFKRTPFKRSYDRKQDRKIAKIARMVEPEYKHVLTRSGNPMTTTTSVNAPLQVLLTNTTQGVGADGSQGSAIRLGDKIFVHGVDISMLYKYQLAGSNFLRLMLIEIKGIYQTIPISQLLYDPSVVDSTFNNLLTSRGMNYCTIPGVPDTRQNGNRVLWEKRIFLPGSSIEDVVGDGPYAITPSAHQSGLIRKKLKFKRPIIVQYDVNAQAQNQLVLVIFGGCHTNANLNPEYAYEVRVDFTDS